MYSETDSVFCLLWMLSTAYLVSVCMLFLGTLHVCHLNTCVLVCQLWWAPYWPTSTLTTPTPHSPPTTSPPQTASLPPTLGCVYLRPLNFYPPFFCIIWSHDNRNPPASSPHHTSATIWGGWGLRHASCPLWHIKPASRIFPNCRSCYITLEGKHHHLHKLSDPHNWLVSLWLTSN